MSLSARFRAILGLPPGGGRSVNPGGEYQPDRRDRYLVVTGIKFTPINLLSYLQRADAGDTRFLYAFYDEMVARDSHLAAEMSKAKSALTGARLDLLPYPAKYRKGQGTKSKPEPGATEELPVTITRYVEEQLKAPHVRIDRAIGALSNGLWKGVGAVEVQWEPRGAKLENGRAVDRVTQLFPIPSQRFRFDPFGTEMMFQRTGDPTDFEYVRDIGERLAVLVGDADRPSPARRGLLRLCMSAWLMRMYGPAWFQRFVELFGSPMRIAHCDANDNTTRAELNAALSQLGSQSYAILPTGATIEFVEAAARMMATPPHVTMLDWCADEISKAILGATQTTDIKPNAGSKASADVHMDVFDRLSASRAQEIAGCIREQIVMPLVARNFGPDNAALYCPEVMLDTKGHPDLGTFATALKTLRDAGLGKTIPVAWAHDTSGIPMADEDDDTLGEAPAPTPFGKPGEPGATEPGGKVVPMRPKSGGAAPTKGEQEGGQPTEGPRAASQGKATAAPGASFADPLTDDVPDELERSAIARKFNGAAGDDIVAPVRDIIEKALKDGSSLHTVLARVEQRMGLAVQAPDTRDLLAAVIAEATFRGLDKARRQRTARASKAS